MLRIHEAVFVGWYLIELFIGSAKHLRAVWSACRVCGIVESTKDLVRYCADALHRAGYGNCLS